MEFRYKHWYGRAERGRTRAQPCRRYSGHWGVPYAPGCPYSRKYRHPDAHIYVNMGTPGCPYLRGVYIFMTPVADSGSRRDKLHSARWSFLSTKSIEALCWLRKSRPRMASVVRGLTTTISVANFSSSSSSSTRAQPWIVSGAPPALTSFSVDHGFSSCGFLAAMRAQASSRSSVTAAPVSSSRDNWTSLTVPNRR